MADEGGAWVMQGMDWDDPRRIRTYRELIAGTGEVAYGKFFGRKSGFISMEWLPAFANFRRDGYDIDARWDDGLANIRHKRIMDCFGENPDGGITEYTGMQLKQLAGFGKGGYKNFDGIMADLQMQTYLVIKEFRRKRNRKGQECGMPVCVYCRPEDLWGYEAVTDSYKEAPLLSKERIYSRLKELYPDADGKAADRLLR